VLWPALHAHHRPRYVDEATEERGGGPRLAGVVGDGDPAVPGGDEAAERECRRGREDEEAGRAQPAAAHTAVLGPRLAEVGRARRDTAVGHVSVPTRAEDEGAVGDEDGEG